MSDAGFIYAISAEGSPYVKIGSAKNVELRRKQLQTGQPLRLHIIASIAVERHARAIESRIHTFLAQSLQGGEWFTTSIDHDRLLVLVQEAQALLDVECQPRTKQNTPDAIGERVHAVRKLRGWSQRELSKRAVIHHVVLNRLEKGHKIAIQAETVRRLAEALQVSSDYLLGLKEDIDQAA
jgi:DNA-binding Xre family transcriptional regulator